MQDRPNEYALEYKLGSEDERQFLVFTTTDFRHVLSTTSLISATSGLSLATSGLHMATSGGIKWIKLIKVTHLAKS